MKKRCKRCGKKKLIADFYKTKWSNPRPYCKLCDKELNKINRERPDYIEKKRWYRVKQKYGLSKVEWQYRFNEQNGCCAICGRHQSELSKVLCVDHCHKTGRVRGLLCVYCNRALGFLRDDVRLIENALNYLAD